MAFFEIYFMVRAVFHPNLKNAFDVHFDHVLFFETVFGLKKFGEDCVIKCF